MAAIHGGIAIALRSPEIALTAEEAREYAELVAAVARHYDVGASAKALDIGALISFQVSIYSVKALALYGRRGTFAPGPDSGEAVQEPGAMFGMETAGRA